MVLIYFNLIYPLTIINNHPINMVYDYNSLPGSTHDGLVQNSIEHTRTLCLPLSIVLFAPEYIPSKET